jgi:hypothetical protein
MKFQTPRALAAFAAVAAATAIGASAAHAAATVTASFEYTPAEPVAGDEITFQSTTTWGAGSIVALSWDLDDDGEFDDGFGLSVQKSFAQAGSHTVRLRASVSSESGTAEDVAERTVVIGEATPDPDPTPQPTPAPTTQPANQPPVATYNKKCSPIGTLTLCAGLLARESVPKLLDASPSRDPDGSIVKYEWDLDSNGSYEVDTGATPTVTHTFEALTGLVDVSNRLVRVRVTDDKGATDVDEVTIRVAEPACQRGLTYGRLIVRATCIRKRMIERDGKQVAHWWSEEPIVINGITLRPRSGRDVSIDVYPFAGPQITSYDAEVTVPAKGTTARLLAGRLDWHLRDGRLTGFAVGAGAKLNGLRITGMPSVPEVFADGSSKLGLRVALPSQFGGASSDEPIYLRPGAFALAAASEPLSFEVANAAIGPIGLEQLKVTYDGVDLWEISARVGLPEPIPYTIEGDAGIRGGEFEHAAAAIDFGTPGVGPFGPVFLQRIGFRVEVNPKKSKCVPHVGVELYDQQQFMQDTFGWTFNPPLPDVEIDYGIPTFALCGNVKLTAGPSILGASAISLDAGLGLATYADRPAVFRAFGKVRLIEIPLAEASFAFHTDGYMKMRADFYWGIEDLASLSGFMNFEAMFPKFNAEAYIRACLEFVDYCAGAKALVSSKGVAVCLKIDVLVDDWEPGFGYRWGEALPTLYFAGCELGPYREYIAHASASRVRAVAAGETRSIDLPAGLPGAVIAMEGRDAAPRVTLLGPDGERITTPDGLEPVEQSPFFVIKDPRAKLTQIAISKPSAGRWTVQVEDGSSELVSLRSANGLDDPEIEAAVSGSGHRRTLSYEIAPVKGQRVTFTENGPSAGGMIGVAHGGKGTLRFAPAEGRGEQREIVALVEQDGRLRDKITVAHYRAPSAQRPGRPQRLRLRRAGTRLVATWNGARAARSYQAMFRLSDGRRTLLTTTRRRVTLAHVARGTRGSVRVRAMTSAGMRGGATVAQLHRR